MSSLAADGAAIETKGPVDSSTAGTVGAMLALVVGFLASAVVDLGGTAGRSVFVGPALLAAAPWVLMVGMRASRGRSMVGIAPIGFSLMLAGAIGSMPAVRNETPIFILIDFVTAAGAAGVLLAAKRTGRIGMVRLVGLLGLGFGLGGALAAAAVDPQGQIFGAAAAEALLATFLFPQLVHDIQVWAWSARTRAHDRGRVTLRSMGMPFILWVLAAHLAMAPSVLLLSSKPLVVFGAVGAAIAFGLFALRGAMRVYSRGAVIGVTLAALVYGVGLFLLVRGSRPY